MANTQEISKDQTEVPIPQNVLRQAEEAEKKLNSSPGEEPDEPAKEIIPPKKDTQLEALQHKFDVLQGKYNAEVPRLNQQVVDAKATIEEKLRQIEDLEIISEEEEQVQENELDLKNYEGFESEILDIVNKVNNLSGSKKDTAIMKKLKGQIAELEKNSEKIAEHESYINDKSIVDIERKEGKYFDEISTGVKDWEAVNNNPLFLNWLSKEDEFSGFTRQEILTKARQTLNSKKTITVFNAFKKSLKRPVRDISGEVVPGGSVNSDGFSRETGSSLTQADVAEAANAFAKGKITEEAFNKIANEFQKTI